MVTISLGSKKKTYKSIAAYAKAAGMPYITAYMRLKFGQKPATAMKKPVRAYRKAA